MMTIRITMWLRPLAHKLSKVGESLFKKLDTILNDQEDQDGLENQLFTYATVVFLPLSFATGIVCTSQAPRSQTLHSMNFLAFMALIAIFVLGVVLRVIMSVRRWIAMLSSITKRQTEMMASPVEQNWTEEKVSWRMPVAGFKIVMRIAWK